jgi:hypothetical protein
MIEEQTSLDDLIADSIRNALQSDSIKKRVQEAADKAISDAISGAFGYSSPFRKGIEEAIREILPIPRAQDLAVFADATRELLQRRLATVASETAKTHLEEVIEKILPSDPVITLKELEEAYKDKLMDENRDECSCDDYVAYTWEIEQDSTHHIESMRRYWDLYFAPTEDESRYGSKTQTLRFKPTEANPELHECWTTSGFDKQQLGKTMFVGPLYGFDLMVWRLATGTAKLKK